MKNRGLFLLLLTLTLLPAVVHSTSAARLLAPFDSVQGETRKLVIKSKPKPGYTSAARRNGVEGRVVLKIEFRADGQIGDILPLEELPDGLTEKAVEAARLIEFEPELRDGQAVSRTLRVIFTFRLH